MNELRFETLTMPAADPGGECAWPPLPVRTAPPPAFTPDPRLPVEEYEYFHWQYHWNSLPYSLQNRYDREVAPCEFRTAVLENGCLRATFLPEFGGRLWSLYDKRQERELLYRNPVFQPGNLALRNAWVAGGIEWNFGWPGHHPYTFAPVFTAEAKGPSYPVLRFYEWERKRRFAWQLDCYFPKAESEFLFVTARVTNGYTRELPVYYWTNIAMPQTPESRVIAPAELAITNQGVLDLPLVDGRDVTYPANNPGAIDYFFYLEPGVRRWEAAVDGGGQGLIFTSSRLLRGRKLFVWGESTGGRHWQDFLSTPGSRYFEIQSGLAKTQMESLPLPPKSAMLWTEAFGALSLAPAAAHGDWATAIAAGRDDLEQRLPEHDFDQLRQIAEVVVGGEPAAVAHYGSGWGALERRRRIRKGRVLPLFRPSMPFPDDSLTDLQRPFLRLLDGEIPPDEALLLPAWTVQPEWRELLEAKREAIGDGSLWVNYQLALCHYDAGEFDAALRLLEDAPAATGRVEAARRRFQAVLCRIAGDEERMLAHWRAALAAEPGDARLLDEAGDAFLAAGRAAEFAACFPPEAAAWSGRLRALAARLALELDELDRAGELLLAPFEIPDLKEGENLLTDLYFRYKTRELARGRGERWSPEYLAEHGAEFADAIPPHLDFRMQNYQPR